MPPAALLRPMTQAEITMGSALYDQPVSASSPKAWTSITWDARHSKSPQITERGAADLRRWVRDRRDRLPAEVVALAEEPAPAAAAADPSNPRLPVEGDTLLLLQALARVREGRLTGFWGRFVRDVATLVAEVEAGQARTVTTRQMALVSDRLWRYRGQLTAEQLAALPSARAAVFTRVPRPFAIEDLAEAVYRYVLGAGERAKARAIIAIWVTQGVVKRVEDGLPW